MPACPGCHKEYPLSNALASISGSVMGDEMTESWFFCPGCQTYFLEICHDRFCGETSVRVQGPYDRQKGEEKIALIRRCPEPWDKHCRCEAHVAYFEGWLD